ncbi:MAG: hypothetical protein M3R38_27415 [Actinomycetota bacterium]|nr:hypothetical protein [Actinomycetota bacterium]
MTDGSCSMLTSRIERAVQLDVGAVGGLGGVVTRASIPKTERRSRTFSRYLLFVSVTAS